MGILGATVVVASYRAASLTVREPYSIVCAGHEPVGKADDAHRAQCPVAECHDALFSLAPLSLSLRMGGLKHFARWSCKPLCGSR